MDLDGHRGRFRQSTRRRTRARRLMARRSEQDGAGADRQRTLPRALAVAQHQPGVAQLRALRSAARPPPARTASERALGEEPPLVERRPVAAGPVDQEVGAGQPPDHADRLALDDRDRLAELAADLHQPVVRAQVEVVGARRAEVDRLDGREEVADVRPEVPEQPAGGQDHHQREDRRAAQERRLPPLRRRLRLPGRRRRSGRLRPLIPSSSPAAPRRGRRSPRRARRSPSPRRWSP